MSTFQQYVISPWLTPVRVASTTNIAGSYYNGPVNNGLAAILTISVSSLTIDSVVVNVGDRVLLTAQTSAFQNGIYVVLSISSTVVLQRSADQQCIEQIHIGQYAAVGAGGANAGSVFVLIEPKPSALGVGNLSFVATAAAGGGTAAAKAASDNSKPNLASINTPTIINHIAVFYDVNGSIQNDPSTAINGGNLQAGLSGTAGTLASFPSAATSGSLILAAVTNSGGNFSTTISNVSSIGQSQVVSIPDQGSATGLFITSKGTGGQSISSALTVTNTLTGNTVNASTGVLTSGSSGTAGTVTSFPATAAKGSLILAAVNNTGNTNTTISNAAMGQASVISIPDPGTSTSNFIISGSSGTQHITTGSLSVDVGNLLAGSSGHAGTVSSFPSAASNGSLILGATTNSAGNFTTTISNATSVAQNQVVSIPDQGGSGGNFITSGGTGTQSMFTGLAVNGALTSNSFLTGSITGRNITSGTNGINGNFVSFPSNASNGTLIIQAGNNSAGFNTTISNATTIGQNQTILIPDGGTATSNFIISHSTVTQHIVTSGLQVDAGNITAGSSGSVGMLFAFPSTASNGYLQIAATNNVGNFANTLTIASTTQNTTYTFQDPGGTGANVGILPNALVNGNLIKAQGTLGQLIDAGIVAANVAISLISLPDAQADILEQDFTLGFAALASAGKVNIQVSSGSKQYAVRDIKMNTSTGLSGVGGNRLLAVSDSTNIWTGSGILATLLITPVNTLWGGVGLPLPSGSNAFSTFSTAGANIFFQYTGGTTDYTAGSVVITVRWQRVA